MTTPRFIAVIDIGKTNAKVVLIDRDDASQVGGRSTPNTVKRDGLYPHADVERLWAFILQSLGELHAEQSIDGISITTHGATAALIGANGLALPVLDYEHGAPGDVALYAEARPDFSETLSPRLPNGLNLGAQIFWQSRAFPEQFAQVSQILTYPQYYAWRLTGVAASEVTSLGCHTDLWAPDKADFSSLVRDEGWRGLFPAVKPAASILGTLLPELAAATGLPVTTPVTCGIHDSNASLVPHLETRQAPFTILSTGTWAIAMTVGGDTGRLDSERDSLANVDAFGRPVPTARFMGGREFDMLVPGAIEPSEADIANVITAEIQALPSFTPGVGPYPHHKGRWTHDPAALSIGERSAVVALYLALVTRQCLDLSGLGREIVIEGPLARNKLFGQALSTLAGVPVTASGDATGTSLGAAMLFGEQDGAAKPGVLLEPLAVDGFDAYAGSWLAKL
ncbi:Xylulose kinase [Devosia sp. LC5]|uniref:FGGY-family carbohydrate kinase n=1 Tax=Devosia sp. LC5 TaxID=1502724 RepID=UPI0004E3FE41|nr:FGGY-family carbohydrate kinase [Devosia sp. LC5]KFC71181.1 Xylulose kinase [Devosia sp. LC5]